MNRAEEHLRFAEKSLSYEESTNFALLSIAASLLPDHTGLLADVKRLKEVLEEMIQDRRPAMGKYDEGCLDSMQSMLLRLHELVEKHEKK